jgi:hypothetical protein
MIVPKLERLIMMGLILRLALALAGAAAMFVTPMFGIARSASRARPILFVSSTLRPTICTPVDVRWTMASRLK